MLAWGILLGGFWLLGRVLGEVSLPLARSLSNVTTVVGLLLGPVLVGAAMGWAFDDPDDGNRIDTFGLVSGGGLVLPRAATVSLLVWFFVGLLVTTVLVATAVALLAFFLSVGAGLVGRRLREE